MVFMYQNKQGFIFIVASTESLFDLFLYDNDVNLAM